MRASILEFARTGRFGDIRVGMTAAEVEAVAGPPVDGWNNNVPDAAAASLKRSGGIWLYGRIELFWGDGKLYLIFWDNYWDPIDGGPIELDPWFVRPGVRVDEVESALRSAAIPFKRGFTALRQQIMFHTAAGVEFMCGRENEDDKSLPFLLCAISGPKEPSGDVDWSRPI